MHTAEGTEVATAVVVSKRSSSSLASMQGAIA
jgi:hypothetical protein